MAQVTITEALAEIKTIGARLGKIQEFIKTYAFRDERARDPLEREGGSVAQIQRQRQAAKDLRERQIQLRSAINRSNQSTMVTVEGTARSVAEWIIWKREIAPGLRAEMNAFVLQLDMARNQARKANVSVVQNQESARNPGDIVSNLPEIELANERDLLEKILGTLDGQLSLNNARTLIEVA